MDAKTYRKRVLAAAARAEEFDSFKFCAPDDEPPVMETTIASFKEMAHLLLFAAGRIEDSEIREQVNNVAASYGETILDNIGPREISSAYEARRLLMPLVELVKELRDELDAPPDPPPAPELIPPRLRFVLRESLVAFSTVDRLRSLFSAAGIEQNFSFQPPDSVKGERRRATEQCYATLDFSSTSDARRFLNAYSCHLRELEYDGSHGHPDNANEFQKLAREAEANGFVLDSMSNLAASSEINAPHLKSERQKEPKVKNRVFVVHGQDVEAADALKDYLRVLRLQPLEWAEAAAMAPEGASAFTYQIVKAGIENSDAVVLLFTPDERVELRGPLVVQGKRSQLRHQPRPNVIFEAGWALGFCRSKVVLVEARGLTEISDIHGLNAVRLDGTVESFDKLTKWLTIAGCTPSDADPARLRIDKYKALYQPVEPPSPSGDVPSPTPSAEAGGRTLAAITDRIKRNYAKLEGLTDSDVIEWLSDRLPNAGFHLFADLDEVNEMPPGTWRKHGPAAAKKKDRLKEVSDNGMRISAPRVIRRT